jgi:hypothetical protein
MSKWLRVLGGYCGRKGYSDEMEKGKEEPPTMFDWN